MVDGTGLENRHTRKGIGGSNPSLSARPLVEQRFRELVEKIEAELKVSSKAGAETPVTSLTGK